MGRRRCYWLAESGHYSVRARARHQLRLEIVLGLATHPRDQQSHARTLSGDSDLEEPVVAADTKRQEIASRGKVNYVLASAPCGRWRSTPWMVLSPHVW